MTSKKKLSTLLCSSVLLSGLLVQNVYAIELQDALVSAYKTNPALLAQRESLKATDETYSQALSGWFPSASVTGQHGRESIRYQGHNRETNTTTSRRINLNQPLFNGGETTAQIHRAKDLVKSGQAELSRVEQNVLLDSITAYMNLYQSQEVLKYSQENVEALRKRVDITDNRFSLGEVTRTDASQAKSRLSRAIADANRARSDWENNRASFQRVIGIVPDTAILPPDVTNLPANLDEAVNIAQNNNPQIAAIQYDALAAGHAVNANKAALLPDVSLQAEMLRSDGQINLGGGTYSSQTALINVTVPLYQSGSEYSRIRASKDQADKRRYDAINTANTVREGTIQAWQNLETARLNVAATADVATEARNALDGVTQEVEAGTRTTLDALDAEQELYSSELEHIRAKRNLVVNAYALKASLGQLTAQALNLPVPLYDPNVHYNKTKFRPAGF